jgi:hypothetical protein
VFLNCLDLFGALSESLSRVISLWICCFLFGNVLLVPNIIYIVIPPVCLQDVARAEGELPTFDYKRCLVESCCCEIICFLNIPVIFASVNLCLFCVAGWILHPDSLNTMDAYQNF